MRKALIWLSNALGNFMLFVLFSALYYFVHLSALEMLAARLTHPELEGDELMSFLQRADSTYGLLLIVFALILGANSVLTRIEKRRKTASKSAWKKQ